MIVDQIINADCMDCFSKIEAGGANLTLTDIPYGAVNRKSGLYTNNLDKGKADIITFELEPFLEELYRITKSTIIIFCGKEQLSEIWEFFKTKKGTIRQIVSVKSNPSPMNGQYVYLSGFENAIWFKKPKGTFNAYCKNPVFTYPCGRAKLHPTEKNINLIRELIRDNSNPGDLVFDPCCGSGTHCLAAKLEGRHYLGIELDKEYYEIAKERLNC